MCRPEYQGAALHRQTIPHHVCGAQPRPDHAASWVPRDARDAVGMFQRLASRAIQPEIVEYVRPEVRCRADRQRPVFLVEQHIGARRSWQAVDQRRVELRRQQWRGQQAGDDAIDRLARVFPMDDLPPLPEQFRIRQRTMTLFDGKPVSFRQRVQVVMLKVWVELSRQHDRADDLRREGNAGALELGTQERVIEARVVRDEQPARQTPRELRARYRQTWAPGRAHRPSANQSRNRVRDGTAPVSASTSARLRPESTVITPISATRFSAGLKPVVSISTNASERNPAMLTACGLPLNRTNVR